MQVFNEFMQLTKFIMFRCTCWHVCSIVKAVNDDKTLLHTNLESHTQNLKLFIFSILIGIRFLFNTSLFLLQQIDQVPLSVYESICGDFWPKGIQLVFSWRLDNWLH